MEHNHTQNPIELIDFVRGAEISSKDGGLTALDAIARSSLNDFNYAFGVQINSETLDIEYNDLARAEFDSERQDY